MSQLQTHQVTLAYDGAKPVVHGVSYQVQRGAITSIIGPNGCGKSTLLRGLARLLRPKHGAVCLDGQLIHRLPTKEVARRLSLLAQHAQAPGSITVEDLVQRGRYPHQAFLQPPTSSDQAAVERALALVGMAELRNRPVDELSGGQRQRAWIALALAQETPILLLDEPTTYLDLAHQQEILALLWRLNREEGRTVVLVLHDINDALRISDQVVVMQEGVIRAEGAPEEILTASLLADVFGLACDVLPDPESGLPVFIPNGRAPHSGSPAPAGKAAILRSERLSAGYDHRRVVSDVSVSLPEGQVTAIVGPNASGKSTLLRSFARLLTPQAGAALLEGQPVHAGSHRAFARRLAIQMQEASAPEGVLVEDLVAAGRHPYQRWYRQWSERDEEVVESALAATGIAEFRRRPVETLSGGQQQRVWLAMSLAQQTPVLLLDEPTSFLDVAHQVEVLDRVWQLSRDEGRTIGLVLHDLGMACRYADQVVVMSHGQVAAAGAPAEVITPALVQKVFGLEVRVLMDPLTGRPLVLPASDFRAGGEAGEMELFASNARALEFVKALS